VSGGKSLYSDGDLPSIVFFEHLPSTRSIKVLKYWQGVASACKNHKCHFLLDHTHNFPSLQSQGNSDGEWYSRRALLITTLALKQSTQYSVHSEHTAHTAHCSFLTHSSKHSILVYLAHSSYSTLFILNTQLIKQYSVYLAHSSYITSLTLNTQLIQNIRDVVRELAEVEANPDAPNFPSFLLLCSPEPI